MLRRRVVRELRQRDDGGDYYGRYAESIWGDPATKLSADCLIPRAAEDYGLSTLIVGFDDPQKDLGSPKQILKDIERAAFDSFWPAMTKGKVKVTVNHEVNGEEVFTKTLAPKQDEQYPLVANLLDDYNAGKIEQLDRLVKPGDRTVVSVPISINEKLLDSADRPSHKALKGHADLVVELLDDDESESKFVIECSALESLIWWFE